MPKIVKTVSPSPVSRMLENIRRNQSKIVPSTLPDIIISYLNPTRNYEFKSAMSSAARLLSPGSEYNDLVGKVIFPAKRKYGPSPKWAGNVSEMDSTVKMPNWTESKELTVLSNKFNNNGVVMTETEISTISKMGRKNYEVTTGLLEKSAEKTNEEALLRRDAESELERSEHAVAELKLEFENRLIRIANSSAIAAVNAALAERDQTRSEDQAIPA